MNLFRTRSLDNTILVASVILTAAVILSFALMSQPTSAATLTASTLTATSSNVYTNTGFATTSRVTTSDQVRYQLTTSGTPQLTPEINIFNMGSTTMSGSATNWFYSTTSVTAWTEGAITFRIGLPPSTGGGATTTLTQANITAGANVTYDKTAPTLNSLVWSDVDGSTQLSATDTLTLTFSETMATSTVTAGNADTTLALNNSHTFGTSPSVSWNTAGTVLTVTLGTSPTVAGADTVDPTTAVKDSVGIADATAAALAITDNLAPLAVSGNAGAVFHGFTIITLTSTGSTEIRYTTDGTTTPTCSVGTVYSSALTISGPMTLKAIGCDETGNATSIVTASYSTAGGGGGEAPSPATPATPATPAIPATSTTPTVPATPAIPATPATNASGLSTSQIQSILDVLASFDADASTIAQVKASLEGTTSPGSVTSVAVRIFKSNLTIGSLGSEVKALQEFLNAHGYPVATSGPGSPGNETTAFGPATRSALSKYQKANGITPAVGYFGAKTRAAVNAD
jgi:hypothetical protein